MTKPDNSRTKLLTYISTGAVVLVLALIVLVAALSPPAPENVVSDMLNSLARKDVQAMEKFVSSPVLENLQATTLTVNESRWQLFWQDGSQLFEHYRIGEVVISGDQAVVTVYYGPGLIQADDFLLHREGRRWKVYGITD
ncbi:MAG TPA: hypothetical protein DG577_05920 [Firmicutes bacterium]|nr:hypothetical protein [Bacillota bacterium]HBS93282.1 hypothetical protein [Bacillota bacterium]HCX78926.1 hypothetical protein [Bacillota bacterium]